jgi:hypothetical protein
VAFDKVLIDADLTRHSPVGNVPFRRWLRKVFWDAVEAAARECAVDCRAKFGRVK